MVAVPACHAEPRMEEDMCFAGTGALPQHVAALLQAKRNRQEHVEVMGSTYEGGKRTAETYPWPEATRKLFQMTPRSEVTETIWSSGEHHNCGSPCVAHCLAGQPREFITTPGLRKALKHRVFERFSPQGVVFAVFPTSAYHNTERGEGPHASDAGTARTQVPEFDNDMLAALVTGMEEVGVSRALLLNETCHDPSCMENSQLQCKASDLNLDSDFGKEDGKMHHICDVQFKRFQTCMTLVREYEEEHSMKFDWVTRNRPDVYWVQPITHVSELEQRVYVSPANGPAYGGMDWFFAIPRKDADLFALFPDQATCAQLHHPQILPQCALGWRMEPNSIGCECWMASWLYKNNMNFTHLTKAPFTVSKFCGDGCPLDWDVNETSIINAN